MSRREYDRYDERETDYHRRGPRTERDYEEVDYRQSRSDGPGPSRRTETVVKERESDTIRTERGPRQPDFLREDYGRGGNSGQLVVRDDREEEYISRRGGPRTSERVERDEVVYRERSRGPPYPRSEFGEDEVVYRERIHPRPGEEIDIKIKEKDVDRGPRVYRNDEEVVYRQSDRLRPGGRTEVDREDVTIRESRSRSRGPPRREEVVDKEEVTIHERSRSRAPPARSDFVEKEDITIRERSRGPPLRRTTTEKIDIDIKERDRDGFRGRDVRDEEIDIKIKEKERDGFGGREVRKEEVDVDIRERDRPGLRHSTSRGALVRSDREVWTVRKRRTPSPSPPRDFEKQEIVIRRKERSISPEPEPIPEPIPEPAIYRPPIIQEVITHHRTIDHGVERVPEPPPLPPTPPPPVKEEEDIDINIRRSGFRNGKPFDENINIDIDNKERNRGREVVTRERDVSESLDLRRTVSGRSRVRYEDEVFAEADISNRRISSRGYPGDAYNGITRERVYERERDYGSAGPPLLSPARDDFRETRIETRIERDTSRGYNRDRKWTEISKDLVIEEAIKECGYEYDENDRYFYVMQYLRYEDVLRLVEVTEDIRRERHERIQELRWETEQRERKVLPPLMPPVPPPPRRGGGDSYYYERDVRFERDGGRYRR